MPIFIYVVRGYSIAMHRRAFIRADHPKNSRKATVETEKQWDEEAA